MKNSHLCTFILPSILLLLNACNDKADAPLANETSTTSNVNASFATDAWLGKWNGPEGTYIEIDGDNGKYEITIQDLDGPKQFQGISNGEQISFERNGTTETIETSNGDGTGMKWLAGKSNCLKVKPREGWCKE